MADGFVSLMAGFKDVGKNGKSKGTIRIQADELLFDPNDRVAAQAFADAIVETTKEHMLQGKAPDGQPLPPLKSSTLERRAVEEAQGTRGGEAHPRYKDPAFRRGVSRRYDRDYKAKAGEFVPVANHPRGEVSGLLIESMSARGDKSGRGVTIYVAAKRGRPRPSTTDRPQETQSALESVLAGAPVVSPRLLQAPKIRRRLTEMVRDMLGKPKDLLKSAKKLLKAATQTAEDAAALADEVANDNG